MSKKIVGKIKFVVGAGKANPSPPVGPALGQKGVNSKAFCDLFNDRTKDIPAGTMLPTEVIVFQDKTFEVTIKTESVTAKLKKVLKIDKFSKTPGTEFVSSITMNQIESIAKEKLIDNNAYDLEAMKKTIIGTAKSCGIKVVE
jgi:large subunit ribosomal protein L11